MSAREQDRREAGQRPLEPYDVRVVVNPMAGKDVAFFGPLATAFSEAGVRWNLDVTNGPGEEAELAKRAIAEGAKVVVAFGGDGTVSAVASALVGHPDVALGILPGGTANVFAHEVGVPSDLEAAARLIAGPHGELTVDLGVAELAGGEPKSFVLRVAVGLEATMVEESPREEKERLGELAYALSTIRQLPNATAAHYRIASESGEVVEGDGLFAVLANARTVGVAEASYPPDVRIDDGFLDGIIAPAALTQMVGAAAAALAGDDSSTLERVHGTRLVLSAEPPQRVVVDGEVVGDTPVTVEVVPAAVRVIVPREESES